MPRRPWALLVPVFVLAAITAFAYAVVVLAIIRYLRRWILLLIAADEIPAPARERMIALQGAFRALGFTDVGLIREKPRPDSEQFIAFLRSGSGTELAIVGAQVIPANTKVIIHTSVIIWSRLLSGPPAETTGLDQFGIREDPSGHLWWVPRTLDPGILTRFHRAACATVGALKRVDPGASLIAWHEKQLAESVEHLRRAGRVEIRADGAAWRPTWRTALRTLPRFLWPMGPIRAALQDRGNSSIYAAAGITAEQLRAARTRFKAVETAGAP